MPPTNSVRQYKDNMDCHDAKFAPCKPTRQPHVPDRYQETMVGEGRRRSEISQILFQVHGAFPTDDFTIRQPDCVGLVEARLGWPTESALQMQKSVPTCADDYRDGDPSIAIGLRRHAI